MNDRRDEVLREIIKGLIAPRKYISCKFFYDDTGSRLFEQITWLPEYYLTRTELSILKTHAQKIMGIFSAPDMIELGSGDCTKISVLLDAIPGNKIPDIRYIPVDISEFALNRSARMLAAKYHGLHIHGMVADITKSFVLPPGKRDRLICFFGSTIGNMNHHDTIMFLKNLKHWMNPGDILLMGMDLVKDTRILTAAYNDRKGITASFNRNILNVINRHAGTNFDPENFVHRAMYDAEKNCIKMYLETVKEVRVTSRMFPQIIHLNAGETIHTEDSYKYTREDIQRLAELSGLKLSDSFTDPRQYFLVALLQCID